MNCELYKYCKHYTETCDSSNCGWYMSELAEFQKLPVNMPKLKLRKQRESKLVAEDIFGYWEELGR